MPKQRKVTRKSSAAGQPGSLLGLMSLPEELLKPILDGVAKRSAKDPCLLLTLAMTCKGLNTLLEVLSRSPPLTAPCIYPVITVMAPRGAQPCWRSAPGPGHLEARMASIPGRTPRLQAGGAPL